MLVMFFGMLRKSNCTTGSSSLLDLGSCICVCDMQVDERNWQLIATLRKSKTNQFRERTHRLVIAGCKGHPLDPVQAVKDTLRINQPAAGQPLFSFREDGVLQPLTHKTLVLATKLLYVCMGKDPNQVSGHSYRRGGATTAFKAGVPDALVQQHGDWASLCYRIYQELSDAVRARATAAMFDLVRKEAVIMEDAVSPWGHSGQGERDVAVGAMCLDMQTLLVDAQLPDAEESEDEVPLY